MKRGIVVLVVLAIIVAAAPWAIGWRTEQLLRARVAQVDLDKSANVRLRIDSYRRGWRSANAQISVIDRDGTAVVRLASAIRHWPFASGGLAEWVAVPDFGGTVREALGPLGVTLPELTSRTTLSWRGDALTKIESAAFKRRVPELAGGTLEIAALAGTIDWRRDGALRYDFALPVFRVERQDNMAAGAPDVLELKDAILKGEGSLGTPERRFHQNGSLAAGSISITEAGKTIFAAANPLFTYASRDEGEYVGMQFTLAVASVSARHALQDLSEAAIEFAFEAGHLAKEPLGRLLDARADAASGDAAGPRSKFETMAHDLLRGSPTADLRFLLKAREGRVELKLALAFDGRGLEAKGSLDDRFARLDARLDARATTALVVAATRAGSEAASGMLRPPGRRDGVIALPDAPPIDPSAEARRYLNEAAAQGLIRFEGDEVVTTVRSREGQLTVNGRDMNALRDMARGLTRR